MDSINQQQNGIIFFESKDEEVNLSVKIEHETVWLTKDQMAELFQRDRTVITRHISNIYKEGELIEEGTCAKNAQVRHEGARDVTRVEVLYNLDVIISVGYRVKSQRGVEFRKWATSVLRKYVLDGYAENTKRLEQLSQITRVMSRIATDLEASQVLDIVQSYTKALDLLDDYDHQVLKQPKGDKATYVLSYEECREVISKMRFGNESELFGVEKDDSFKGSIGNIYQSFDGQELYPSLQEKAANFLYFVVKNHSFLDGNKRIAATMFLYFLNQNQALYIDGRKTIDDATLVAITIMIAESKPEEKASMVALVMNFLQL